MKIAPIVRASRGARRGRLAQRRHDHARRNQSPGDRPSPTGSSSPSPVSNISPARKRIHYVGHVMVDNVLYQAEKLAQTELNSNVRLQTTTSPRLYPLPPINPTPRPHRPISLFFPHPPRANPNRPPPGSMAACRKKRCSACRDHLRENTERPITVEEGTNASSALIRCASSPSAKALRGEGEQGRRPRGSAGRPADSRPRRSRDSGAISDKTYMVCREIG